MIELLESRIAPAGIVNATLDGAIFGLAGDGADNQIQITPLGGGVYNVVGLNGTGFTLADDPFVLPGFVIYDLPLGGLQVDLGAGNDSFEATGLKVAFATTLTGGTGDDTFTLSDHFNGGAVTLTGDDGNDTLILGGTSVTMKSKLTFNGAGGTNRLQFVSTSGTYSSIVYSGGSGQDSILGENQNFRAASLTANLGDGTGEIGFEVGTFTLGATLNVTFGVSNNAGVFISADTVAISSGVTVAFNGTGAVNSSESFVGIEAALTGRIGGPVTVTGGLGAVALSLEGNEFSVGGAITFAPLGTEGSVNLEANTFKVSGDIKYTGTANPDALLISASSFTATKKAVLNLGGGSNVMLVTAAASAFTGGVFYTGGAQQDVITVNGATKIGTFNAQFGAGAGTLSVSGPAVEFKSIVLNAPTVIGETFASQIGATELKLKTSATFTGGAGSSSLAFGSEFGDFTAGGDLIFTGGSGSEAIEIFGAEVRLKSIKAELGEGNGGLSVSASQLSAGGIRYRALSGSDEVYIAGGAGLVGLVDVNAGTGSSLLSVSSTDELRVAGVNYNASNSVLETASLTLARLFVAAGVNVNTGDGADTISLSQSNYRGTVLMQTKGGADTVNVDTTPNQVGSVFRKLFSVILGEGNDSMTVGAIPNLYPLRPAIFHNGLNIDAAGGNDTTDIFGNGYTYVKEPVVKDSENAS